MNQRNEFVINHLGGNVSVHDRRGILSNDHRALELRRDRRNELRAASIRGSLCRRRKDVDLAQSRD